MRIRVSGVGKKGEKKNMNKNPIYYYTYEFVTTNTIHDMTKVIGYKTQNFNIERGKKRDAETQKLTVE